MTEIDKLLKTEGGYVNDPADPGGETNFGISKRSYPDLDIKNVTADQAAEIYRTDFLKRYNIIGITDIRLRWKVLDMSVNMGPLVAGVILQLAIGRMPDGVIGPDTLKTANSVVHEVALSNIIAIQKARYQGIVLKTPSQGRFLTGWLRRADDDGSDLTI